jgi:hypothetical protein
MVASMPPSRAADTLVQSGDCQRRPPNNMPQAGRRTLQSRPLLAAGVKSTVMAGENLTVGSTVWLPAESLAPGR